jgi:TPR repeat protein
MLFRGDGVPMDKSSGANYYKLAADQEDGDLQYLYAKILYRGDGIPVDKELASSYFKMTADDGSDNEKAQYRLAKMLRDGDGIPQDLQSALRYFELAVENGCEKARLEYEELQSQLLAQGPPDAVHRTDEGLGSRNELEDL